MLALVAGFAFQVAQLRSQVGPPGGLPRVAVDGRAAVAGEVLVQFETPQANVGQDALGQQIDAALNVAVGRGGLRRYRSRTFDVETLMAFFRARPGVVFAEPNYIVTTVATPNDPELPNLWGLLNIGQSVGEAWGTSGADVHAIDAWGVSTGSTANVVAIIDTGIDYTHPDLAANIWSAPSAYTVTLGGVSIVCPAGSHGFNAITRLCDPMDDHDHGTHVSGTIGGVGNNGLGVVGVNWTTSIIGGKFLDASGIGITSDAIDTIEFMIQTEAAFAGSGGANIRILNNSWGGGGFSLALRNAIASADASNMLFVAAAGNDSSNSDLSAFYPASFDVPNVVAVASTTNQDYLSSFSNYGSAAVDLGAPGSDILSTARNGKYKTFSGTSMATPHVAGAAALVLSRCALDTAELKATLLSTVDVLGSLVGLWRF
jgi:subtilisin family serine protease